MKKYLFIISILIIWLYSACSVDPCPISPNDYRHKFEGIYNGVDSLVTFSFGYGSTNTTKPYSVVVSMNCDIRMNKIIVLYDWKIDTIPIDTLGTYYESDGYHEYSLKFIKDSLYI